MKPAAWKAISGFRELIWDLRQSCAGLSAAETIKLLIEVVRKPCSLTVE